jgi:hypothetical protein
MVAMLALHPIRLKELREPGNWTQPREYRRMVVDDAFGR